MHYGYLNGEKLRIFAMIYLPFIFFFANKITPAAQLARGKQKIQASNTKMTISGCSERNTKKQLSSISQTKKA